MRKEQLIPFIGKNVKITEWNGQVQYGKLHRIIDRYIPGDNFRIPHAINNGWYLDMYYRTYGGGIDYRSSHIKKIELWDGRRRG